MSTSDFSLRRVRPEPLERVSEARLAERDGLEDAPLGDLTVVDPPAEILGTLSRIVEHLNLKLTAQSRVLVTIGTAEGEGVSTIARWLAASLAVEPAAKVLYMDTGDKAAPAGRHGAGASSDPISAAIRRTTVRGLLMMHVRNALTEVTPTRISGLLDVLRQRFSHIVVDAEPPTASPLSLSLASHGDGVLLVIAANATDREQVAATADLLRRNGATIVGAVLNKIRMR